MDREKQIEEMANEIYETLMLEAECPLSGMDCAIIADLLVAKGYRKASDVAREIFEEILDIVRSKYEAVTTDCHCNMCYGNIDAPNGMRDLGKAEMLKYLGDKVAELKKKYTEGKKDNG